MFIDKVEIIIKAGNGGNGHTSFYRDKMTMRGGPDGGDGGRGGGIVFVGSMRADNLVEFRFVKKFLAKDGEDGSKRNKSGASSDDLKIPVPLGTKIYNEKKELIADITEKDQEFHALRGGAGGKGNAFFATSCKQTPNFSKTGIKTKEYNVTLELSCIADVGLIGFPNVGKSTLLSVISRANPKIADYHFTTLYPNLGVVVPQSIKGLSVSAVSGLKPFIVADIPGLIEGASEGVGLGHEFLRHIKRTRLLVHVVDISGCEGRDPIDDFYKINNELEKFEPELLAKPQFIALNKTDVDSSRIADFKKTVNGYRIFEISAATGHGISELIKEVALELQKLPKIQSEKVFALLEDKVDKNKFDVRAEHSEDYSQFTVTGPLIDNLIRGVVLSDTESNAYFQRRLAECGVISALRAEGLKNGDTVRIVDIEFEWLD